MSDYEGIVDFIFEINNMKRLKHSGTRYAGVSEPDSIAEHVFRVAQIGYILAGLEGVDRLKVLEICLFHDNGEVRVGDHTLIAQRYFDRNEGEEKAFEDQIAQLPDEVRARLTGLITTYNDTGKPVEYVVARDADLLETIFKAHEWAELGYPLSRWVANGKEMLSTKSAQKIVESMEGKSFVDWWYNLNKV